jgi:tetratricopeptide (TPR) repeat protein
MAKKQWILALSGLVLLASLFYFGRTVAVKSKPDQPMPSMAKTFNINSFIDAAKKEIDPSQAIVVSKLENQVTRGDVGTQQIETYKQLAAYWKDTIHVFEPYAYYLSEAAKLEKSEKNLTFAAQLILTNLRGENDEAKLNWKAEEAIALFENVLAINPDNDEAKIGLGSCYIFGKGRFGGPQETMKGIQQVLQVVRKDSNNMKAQFVLGVGGFISGQYDKAIERLTKVVSFDPGNIEAVAYLADAYAAKGNKAEALKWYQVSKRLINNPAYTKEVDERIRQLQ